MKPLIERLNLSGTPFEIYKFFHEEPYSFFLDSAMDAGKLGRFSFIGTEPFLTLSSRSGRTNVNCQGWKKSFSGSPFYVLRKLLEMYKTDFRAKETPFFGGAVGWFSYDLKNFIEELPDSARDDLGIADMEIGFYDCVLIFDKLKKASYVASTGFPETGRKGAFRAAARMEKMKERLEGMEKGRVSADVMSGAVCGDLSSNFSKEEYKRAVLKAKEYIKSGDIYQVNLSQRFSAGLQDPPFNIYEILRKINPAPFASYLNFGDVQVASASPERFLKVSGRHIQTRPIKGTRPRGRSAAEDGLLRRELLSSAKDRAENLMIIDLERNDLGRISEYGSVSVSEFMICEEFPTVFHLTSTVEGRLRKDVDAVEALLNSFPGGSITGAPKIRSMEIIEELEGLKRSIYTGSIGYIGFNGDMDTSVVIRTFLFKGNKLYFNVGGGIVYDSDPEKEYEETLHKARALMEAIGQDSLLVSSSAR